ncbi:methylamine utilization protein [Phenylobacterium sp.]|uniref:methylamine utilization protein n=1 Tax=Phenylobacterium sp. TaxID=1871053 RepID=UPI0011F8D2BB|nr:methylamine utilization protein [Phenylobacterium sp.]THD58574.1 MAG: methylamine utilization protein [Phenylobacterium sp.]
MLRHILPIVATALVFAGQAAAADLTVTVKGEDGSPLVDAVVLVHTAGGAGAAGPIHYSWPNVMTQQNISFNPYVLIVPVGSTVAFPNKDKVRHHVYSFSAAKKFELKLYGQQEERTVTFDKAGIVPLGCNIHDSMIGYIYVADTPFAAKTNAAGEAVIHGLPGVAGTLSVWHPDMKAKAAVDKPLAATATDMAVSLELKPVSMRHKKMAM